MKVARNLAGILIILMLAIGCAGSGVKDPFKTVASMTSQQRATWMQNMWSDAHDSYEAMVKRPNLTCDQKLMLNYKYDMLVKSRPLIKLYRSYVDSGAKPSSEVEGEIIALLDAMTMAIVPMLEGGN